jgi:opacity protein-like surface antigen
MTKVLLAGVAAIAMMTGGALAADVNMPLKAPAPAAYDWGGFYVGAQAGWTGGTGTSDIFSSLGNNLTRITTFSDTGFAGGVQGGYNWVVFPNWLLGLEANAFGTSMSHHLSGCTFDSKICTTSEGFEPGFISFRGRVGYIWDNLLFYATAGYAAFDHRTSDTITCASTAGLCPGAPNPTTGAFANVVGVGATQSAWSTGWEYGGGVEWGFAPRWTARIDYSHYQFDFSGGFSYGPCSSACSGPLLPLANVASTYKATTDFNAVMVGVNYLFWPGL